MSIKIPNNTVTSLPPIIVYQLGFQLGGNYVVPTTGPVLTSNPNYELIFAMVTLSKSDLAIIQSSNNLMSMPRAFANAEAREGPSQPVPAISIDLTALNSNIELIDFTLDAT